MSGPSQGDRLQMYLASLVADHSDLPARLRTVKQSIQSKNQRVRIHAHFLPIRDSEPTVGEFIDVLCDKLTAYCLHRKQIQEAQAKWAGLSQNKILESAGRLRQQAIDLFKKACENTNRNGEVGELATYLLIEYALEAPQLLAKMSLKTSSQMPVHGSDGIHIGYDSATGALRLYWGESKCYASIDSAIAEAIDSIADNLVHKKMKHELFLVESYFDLAGFPEDFRQAILSFIDPFHENYNKRTDVSAVFINFNFSAFAMLQEVEPAHVETEFAKRLHAALPDYVKKLDAALTKRNVKNHTMEIFFLPVPSVELMRKMFQDKIGWKTQ